MSVPHWCRSSHELQYQHDPLMFDNHNVSTYFLGPLYSVSPHKINGKILIYNLAGILFVKRHLKDVRPLNPSESHCFSQTHSRMPH